MKLFYSLLVSLSLIIVLTGCQDTTSSNLETKNTTVHEESKEDEKSAGSTAGNEEEPSNELTGKTISSLVEDQKLVLSDYDTIEAIHLTSQKIPDLVAIHHDDTYSHVRIDQYDLENERWVTRYSLDDHEHFNIEKLDLLSVAQTPEGLEQAAVGYRAGSGGFLSIVIFGSTNQKPGVVYDSGDEEYPDASLYARNDHWEVANGSGILATIPY